MNLRNDLLVTLTDSGSGTKGTIELIACSYTVQYLVICYCIYS